MMAGDHFQQFEQDTGVRKNPLAVSHDDRGFDIACVIGLYQERDEVLLLKQLMLEVPGSIATLTRRISKLRLGGYVLADSYGADRRVTSLQLNPSVQKIYLRTGFCWPRSDQSRTLRLACAAFSDGSI